MSEFVHLHLHSEYSLLDGACRIKDIVARAKECGHSAVAITDHGAMYGTVEFYRACKSEGIKPIIGCEVYLAPRSRFDKSQSYGPNSHLVLLCENEIGYKNLMYLVSCAFTEGFYSKPRVDKELLRAHSEGLIALSACLAGRIPRHLLSGNFELAKSEALEMADIFGKDNFYIEIQNHGLEEQKQILPELIRLADECHLPLVATNDCHYLRRSDAQTQAILMCVQTNTSINDGRPIGFETDEFFYKTTDEMKMLFGRYDGAIENTVKIAQRCNVELDFSSQYLPKFPCPSGISAEAYLRKMTYEGLAKRELANDIEYTSAHPREEYVGRAEYELSVINSMGYADYFLIVSDYVGFAKSKDIPVGPGRGSGAGSLVAYLLGITEIDSIKFELYFERFLNPERISMPDIDVDFCYNRRDEVIKYVTDKYGAEHVSQIITFGTLAARAAIRDVGRALGMSYADVDAVAKQVPQELGITIEQALKLPAMKEKYESSAEARKLIDTAMALEGMPRNVSIHAAGIVITDKPIYEYVPMATSNGVAITQFDMDTISALGLLKFDFLALRYLTIVHEAQAQIRERIPSFDITKIPLDDKATYDLISRGNTSGVFQLESGGMKQMLSNLKPENINDILAAIALYRPGPMDSIPKYIECRHDPSKITYDTPLLKPVLESTYGCTVYQEQVMSIFSVLAGYTYGHADIVRRAMSKKKARELEAERENFIRGASENGISEQTATKIFNDMASFANYAFNKSHAAAYAMISYRTAYLKTHYPREYFSAMLTSVMGNPAKIAEYIAECSKRAIAVLPPDINESRMNFNVSGQDIRFGLLALKNVGRQFIGAILSERERGGKFSSFTDFVNRMEGHELNKRQVEALIKSGAFDNLGVYRSRLLASYEKIIDLSLSKNRSNISGQLDMFSQFSDSPIRTMGPDFEYPNIPELSIKEKLTMEKEASGMYFSGHLLDSYSRHIDTLVHVGIESFVAEDADVEDKQAAKTLGVISSITLKTTKNGDKMAFFTLENRYASIECIVFAKQFRTLSPLIAPDTAVYVTGNLSLRDEEDTKIIVSAIEPLVENSRFTEPTSQQKAQNNAPVKRQVRPEPQKATSKLYLKVPDMVGEKFKKVINLIEIFDGGEVEVVLYDDSQKAYRACNIKICFTETVGNEFSSILGDGNVIPK